MMTFSPIDIAEFFGAKSRSAMSAETALKELEARGITRDGTVRLASPRALCDSHAQRAGHRLNDLTAHQMAAILRGVAA